MNIVPEAPLPPAVSARKRAARADERLALVEEITDEAAHQLLIAVLHLASAIDGTTSALAPADALTVARTTLGQGLEALRRMHKAIATSAAGPPDGRAGSAGAPAPPPAQLGARLDAACESRADAPAGFRTTVARCIHLLHEAAPVAEVDLQTGPAGWRIVATWSDAAASPLDAQPELAARIGERLRWFGGRMAHTGSRAIIDLPLGP